LEGELWSSQFVPVYVVKSECSMGRCNGLCWGGMDAFQSLRSKLKLPEAASARDLRLAV